MLTVECANGQHLTYDPRRLHGVTVYRDAEREFSARDRVQFTAPYRQEGIANRQLGTVEQIDAGGNLQIRLDSGRDVEFHAGEHPHLDYGYAVTSHPRAHVPRGSDVQTERTPFRYYIVTVGHIFCLT